MFRREFHTELDFITVSSSCRLPLSRLSRAVGGRGIVQRSTGLAADPIPRPRLPACHRDR
jgi:hypothetical protein